MSQSIAKLTVIILAMTILPTFAGISRADDFQNPKANIPPKATPQRQNGGEGVPPLPLPATPLRRSEKKREPSPPALVGAITFSAAELKGTGLKWETTIIDIEKWVDFTNAALGQRYRYVSTDFGKFSYDPTELPILYFTGWRPMPHLDDDTIQKLRVYLMDGGTLVVHSNCGRPEFNDSFRQEIQRIFPDRSLAPIGKDHPIWSAFHDIHTMRIRKGKDAWQQVPVEAGLLETINIGTRAAVIFSPIDMSCGWDADAHPIDGGILYDQNDALRLGANITTYVLAEYQYGRFFDHQKVYHQEADKTRDQLVLGQLVHNGDWDPTPHGLPNLLKNIDQNTTLHVQFKRVAVDPDKTNLLDFPVLFMVGQRDFHFSDDARKRLRQYFDHGGTLIVDSAVGNEQFTLAFKKEIALIYPDKKLQLLPPDHPIMNYVFDERHVELAPLGKQMAPGIDSPQLLAIEVDGAYPVIFSPLSLSAGWEQLPRAYNVGYADQDALKVGINVFMYVVSH